MLNVSEYKLISAALESRLSSPSISPKQPCQFALHAHLISGVHLCLIRSVCGIEPASPGFKTVKSPYDGGEVLMAMPAIKLDVALVHVSRADRRGNTLTLGPDPYFDDLFARAAGAVYVTTEELVDSIASENPEEMKANLFEPYLVKGVVETPLGAHPTTSHYGYGWDNAHFKAYAASASEEKGWQAFFDKHIAGDEASYIESVGGEAYIRKLPLPVF